MALGWRAWDESGNLVQDVSTAFGRVLGTQALVSDDGMLTDDRLLDGTPWFCFLTTVQASEYYTPTAGGTVAAWPTVTFSGNQMTWAYPTDSWIVKQVVDILYGTY